MTRRLLVTLAILPWALPGSAEAQVPGSFGPGDFAVQVGIGVDLAYRLHVDGQFTYNVTDRVLVTGQLEGGHSIRSMGVLVGLAERDFSSISSLATLLLGGGARFGRSTVRHTFLLLAGPQYSHIRESHAYPDLEPASVSASAWLVDVGVQYGLRLGSGRSFLSSRIYLPLRLIPDNLMGLTASVGVGLRMP